MKSHDLIDGLVGSLKPVSPLAPPPTRVAYWLAASLLYVVAVVAAAGLRLDIAEKLQDTRFLVELGSTVATAVLAALAALASVSPGRSRLLILAPLPAVIAWLGSLGEGCLRAWRAAGLGGLDISPDWYCFPAIATVSVVPTLVIVVLARRGMSSQPAVTMALATLSAASMGAAGLRLFHTQDASVMILIWQFGTVAIFTLIGALAGRALLPRLEDQTDKVRNSLSRREIVR